MVAPIDTNKELEVHSPFTIATTGGNSVIGILRNKHRVHKPKFSVIDGIKDVVFVYSAGLMLANKQRVGKIRISYTVPYNKSLPSRFRVDWTRNAFGFWYSYRRELDNNIENNLTLVLEYIWSWIKHTIDGTIRLKSMNKRSVLKIKKDNVKDYTYRNGDWRGRV